MDRHNRSFHYMQELCDLQKGSLCGFIRLCCVHSATDTEGCHNGLLHSASRSHKVHLINQRLRNLIVLAEGKSKFGGKGRMAEVEPSGPTLSLIFMLVHSLLRYRGQQDDQLRAFWQFGGVDYDTFRR